VPTFIAGVAAAVELEFVTVGFDEQPASVTAITSKSREGHTSSLIDVPPGWDNSVRTNDEIPWLDREVMEDLIK
jgi:hypothetical protein